MVEDQHVHIRVVDSSRIGGDDVYADEKGPIVEKRIVSLRPHTPCKKPSMTQGHFHSPPAAKKDFSPNCYCHSPYSPSDSETASSSSTFGSPSFSHRSRASSSAKDEFSPVTAADSTQARYCEKAYAEKALKDDFLEFNFHGGRMVEEREPCKQGRGICCGCKQPQCGWEPQLWHSGLCAEVLDNPSACNRTDSASPCHQKVSKHSSTTKNLTQRGDQGHKLRHPVNRRLMVEHQPRPPLSKNTFVSIMAQQEPATVVEKVSRKSKVSLPSGWKHSSDPHPNSTACGQEAGFSFQPQVKVKCQSSSSMFFKEDTSQWNRKSTDGCSTVDSFYLKWQARHARDNHWKPSLNSHKNESCVFVVQPCHNPLNALSRSGMCSANYKLMDSEDPPLSPLSVTKVRYSNDCIPVSPHRVVEEKLMNSRYVGDLNTDMQCPSLHTSHTSVRSSLKAQVEWRSKSLGARASLKSAVRNLEAAFAGSRSVSVPKTRSLTPKREAKSENSKLLDRLFASPLKNRHKRPEILKPLQRPPLTKHGMLRSLPPSLSCSSYSGTVPSALLAKPIVRPSPSVSYNSSEFRISCRPFLPTSRNVRCLPAPKGGFGQENPVLSIPSALNVSSRRSNASVPSMMHGYLHCILRDGVPCYTFTVKGSEEMLLARGCTLDYCSDKTNCKWMYTFHLGRSKTRGKGMAGWRSWMRKDNKTATDFAGKMLVSSVHCPEVAPTGEVRHSIVSEFSLFDGRADDAARSQSLRLLSSDMTGEIHTSSGKGWRSSVSHSSTDDASPTSSSRQTPRFMNSGSENSHSQVTSPMKGSSGHRSSVSVDVWSDSELPDKDVAPGSPSPSHLELAAMIIRVPISDSEQWSQEGDCHATSRAAQGWGLKFLDANMEEMRCGVSRTLSLNVLDSSNVAKYGTLATGKVSGISSVCSPTDNCDGEVEGDLVDRSTSEPKILRMQSSPECVTLLLPTGQHSVPDCESTGPSTLIERWKAGGKCNCGGWDLGCGMKVLSTEMPNRSCTPCTDSIKSLSPEKPLNIFSQGSKQEVMLTLSVVQQGFLVLDFQAQLSPLRAFATAVAVMHSREESSPGSLSPTSSASLTSALKVHHYAL